MVPPKKSIDRQAWSATKVVASIATLAISVLFLLVVITLAINVFSTSFSQEIKSGNVAVISVKGVIASGQSFVEGSVDSEEIKDFLKQASEDSSIKAIILDINSPGGTPVASEEIATAVKKTNKTTIALIRDVGASGAYWVASATNQIWASKLSVTGSIGVIGSYLEFAKLAQDWNVTYRRLVGGAYKDVGDPLSELTPEKERLLQEEIDLLHTYFIEAIAQNRNLSLERVQELADGRTYLGAQAQELGLIDQLGNMDDAIATLEKQLGTSVEPVFYEHKFTLFDILGRLSTQAMHAMGKGIGAGLVSRHQFMT